MAAETIIDNKIKDLVEELETSPNGITTNQDIIFQQLIAQLDLNLIAYKKSPTPPLSTNHQFLKFPTDQDGYAIGLDPLHQEREFLECWNQYSLVVGKNVISTKDHKFVLQRLNELLKCLSRGKFRANNPESCRFFAKDSNETSCLSRGFFEVYHDDGLAQIRQALRIYLHHVLIWKTTKLWTSFDRFGVKTNYSDNSPALPLHVDQNPFVHPYFKTTQGILALKNCSIENGAFAIIPGSNKVFSEFKGSVQNHDPKYRGEYVQADWDKELAAKLLPHLQPLPLRARHLVTWDSRTAHCNLPIKSNSPRLTAFISAGPIPSHTLRSQLRKTRLNALQTGEGKNVREALMHASKPPRFNNTQLIDSLKKQERLTYLGKRLYGLI